MKRHSQIKSGLKFFCSIVSFFVTALCLQAQQKRIYIANDDHTDYMWCADENTYRNAFVNMLDYYIHKADSTIAIGLPSDFQSRFNCDGSFWLWTYEQNRTKEKMALLIDKIKSGHISAPLNALASDYGGTPAEAVLRGMYYAGSLERRFNLQLELAMSMENATLPLGLASLWAGSGAKYSWKGVCACRNPFKPAGPINRDKEVYWYTGLDGKRVLLKWYSLNDTLLPEGLFENQSLGGYSEARNPFYAVTACKKKFNTLNYKKYKIAGAFGYGWDDVETYNSDDFINAARTETDSSYRVIVSNTTDFFNDFENIYGADLSSFSGSFGNERDLLCASLAQTSSKVKRSLEKLRSAEAMAVLITPDNPNFGRTLDSARIKAWMGYGLYWEHDWSVGDWSKVSSSQRAAWQRKIEHQISNYTNTLYDSALVQLGKQIAKTGISRRFFVFNPLNWERSDFADYPYEGADNITVIDISTNAQAPHQIIIKNGSRHLRILASNIPSVGYKVFEIQTGRGRLFGDAATVSAGNTVMENKLYKITINKAGVITSLVDKKNNRECIGIEKANDLGNSANTGSIAIENSGPVSVTLKAVSSDPLSHTSTITLYRDLPRVDIDNKITQNFTDVRQWKFDFNLKTPETWHEEVGAIIKARLDSRGGHYASDNALYKYLTLNHFASVNEKSYGITLSNNDCYFMKLGNSSHFSLDDTSHTLNVLAGGRVSDPEIGILNQDGDTLFNQNFAISTHTKFNEANEMKLALAHQNPFATGTVTGESGKYPASGYSYLTTTDPSVLLWALKPAEEGYADRGVIMRLWNLGSKASKSSILFHGKIAEAWQTSHVETDISTNPYVGSDLKINIPAQGMNSYRAKFSSVLK